MLCVRCCRCQRRQPYEGQSREEKAFISRNYPDRLETVPAGLFRGRQLKGLVGPNRTTCGVPVALARCIGAESTVTSRRACSSNAARTSRSSSPERSSTVVCNFPRMVARCARSGSFAPPDKTGKRPSSVAANLIIRLQRSGSQNFSARAEPGWKIAKWSIANLIAHDSGGALFRCRRQIKHRVISTAEIPRSGRKARP